MRRWRNKIGGYCNNQPSEDPDLEDCLTPIHFLALLLGQDQVLNVHQWNSVKS